MSEAKIITQYGDPVEGDTQEEPLPIDDIQALTEGINESITGFRKIRNSFILRVGAVAVAIKLVDVAGKIIMENQRLKAKPQQQDNEK